MKRRCGGTEISVGRYYGPGLQGEGMVGLTWMRLTNGWHFGFLLLPRVGVHLAWWGAR